MPAARRGTHRIERAKKLRSEMSESQKRLWQRLRAGRIGFSIRREAPIGPYTMDFYCREARLCVEVDGDQHDDQIKRDEIRDSFLKGQRIQIVRFSSRECFFETDSVAEQVKHLCIQRTGREPEKPPP